MITDSTKVKVKPLIKHHPLKTFGVVKVSLQLDTFITLALGAEVVSFTP
jgi:hypothetical protein